MWARTSLGVLFVVSAVLGCSSHEDGGSVSAGGAPSAGATSAGGGDNAGGELGRAGASATGGTNGNESAGASVGGSEAGDGSGGGSSGGATTQCPLPLTVGDHSHLTAVEQVSTYFVSGANAQQLRQSINANRGHDYDALTTWNIAWSYQNCTSPVWTVSLSIAYDLPEWDPPPSADAALVADWDHHSDALHCHEYGHGQIGLDCANSIYAAFASLQSAGDCDALSAAATAKFQELLDQCKTREVAYDADTMHGATMGAVFPSP